MLARASKVTEKFIFWTKHAFEENLCHTSQL